MRTTSVESAGAFLVLLSCIKVHKADRILSSLAPQSLFPNFSFSNIHLMKSLIARGIVTVRIVFIQTLNKTRSELHKLATRLGLKRNLKTSCNLFRINSQIHSTQKPPEGCDSFCLKWYFTFICSRIFKRENQTFPKKVGTVPENQKRL